MTGCSAGQYDVVGKMKSFHSAAYISNKGDIAAYDGFDKLNVISPEGTNRKVDFSKSAKGYVFTIDASPKRNRVMYLDNSKNGENQQVRNKVALWEMDIKTGDVFQCCVLPSRVERFLYSPNGKQVAAIVNSNLKSSLRLINIKDGILKHIKLKAGAVYYLLSWSRSGEYIYCAQETDSELEVLQFSLKDGKEASIWGVSRKDATGITGQPAVIDGSRILYITQSGKAVLMRNTGSIIHSVELPNHAEVQVFSIGISDSGRYAAVEYESAGPVQNITFIDLDSMKVSNHSTKLQKAGIPDLEFINWHPSRNKALIGAIEESGAELREYRMNEQNRQ